MINKPSTFDNPNAIHFCRAPSGLLVGWIKKDNAHYWGSGRTYEDMEKHVKNTLYVAKRCSTLSYFLDSSPVDPSDVPIDVMSKHFRTRAWFGDKNKEIESKVAKQPVQKRTRKVTEREIKYDYYDTAMDGDQLVVYGVLRKEVARYKTNPSNRTQDWRRAFNPMSPLAVTNDGDNDD